MKCINCPLLRDTSCITDDCEEYDFECWVDGKVPDYEGCTRTNKWILAQDVEAIKDKYWQNEADSYEAYFKELQAEREEV